jgi:hypothetical protein
VRSEVDPLMREIGITDEPEVKFWRRLDSYDEAGWES